MRSWISQIRSNETIATKLFYCRFICAWFYQAWYPYFTTEICGTFSEPTITRQQHYRFLSEFDRIWNPKNFKRLKGSVISCLKISLETCSVFLYGLFNKLHEEMHQFLEQNPVGTKKALMPYPYESLVRLYPISEPSVKSSFHISIGVLEIK